MTANLFEQLEPTERNRNDRIRLRKAVGRKISNVDATTLTAFYSRVPRCPVWFEDRAFYLACLYCEQENNGRKELPEAWADYAAEHNIENKVLTRLVDSPWNDNVALALVRIIRRMISEGHYIDFEKLAKDVRYWNSEITRRKWARKISNIEEDIK